MHDLLVAMKEDRCWPLIRYPGSSSLPGMCVFCAGAGGAGKIDSRDRNLPKESRHSAADLTTGRQYFLGHCAQCHAQGEGGEA